jgi:hypothetical protein
VDPVAKPLINWNTPGMSPEVLAYKITERNPVRRWQQLKLAGYPPTDALVLSRRIDIDVHLAAKLLRQGCPVGTAMRILL